MFDSGISVKDLVDELKNTEVDIALDIPDKTYAEWLNALQQLLYSEIIKEQRKIPLVPPQTSTIPIDSLPIESNENKVRFEDIMAIYAEDNNTVPASHKQLLKSSVASGVIFPDTYYKDNNNIGYNTTHKPTKLHIVYIVKPALVTCNEDNNIKQKDANNKPINVMVPVEFIELVKAKLRGEAYKLANEDSIAAKWLNDYNVLLETFKLWLDGKSSKFGI